MITAAQRALKAVAIALAVVLAGCSSGPTAAERAMTVCITTLDAADRFMKQQHDNPAWCRDALQDAGEQKFQRVWLGLAARHPGWYDPDGTYTGDS